MAGLLKAALALDREIIPPTIHCEKPNPKIPFEALNLRLVRNIEPVKAPEGPYAGVNSFGFGGTNAHVVLARPTRCEEAPAAGPLPPLVISAQTEASLRSLVQSWRTALAEVSPERAPMLLRAAARGRDHHPHRLVALSQDPAAMAQTLAGFLNDEPSPFLIAGTGVREGKLAFVFSGNGAQFAGMGRDALRSNAAFRGAIEDLDRILRPELGWSRRRVSRRRRRCRSDGARRHRAAAPLRSTGRHRRGIARGRCQRLRIPRPQCRRDCSGLGSGCAIPRRSRAGCYSAQPAPAAHTG